MQANLKTNDFQLQLENLKRDGYTNSRLLSWLHEQGIHTSDQALKRRLQVWGVPSHRRRTEVDLNSVDRADELAERVNYLFHHTLLSSSQIAIKNSRRRWVIKLSKLSSRHPIAF